MEFLQNVKQFDDLIMPWKVYSGLINRFVGTNVSVLLCSQGIYWRKGVDILEKMSGYIVEKEWIYCSKGVDVL